MNTPTVVAAVLDEKLWRAWVEQRDQGERATDRKLQLFLGVFLALLAVVGAVYFLWVK